VHLTNWPQAGDFPGDVELVNEMDRVRQVASAGLSLRKAQQIRVRQPLSLLTVVADGVSALEDYDGVLAEELNVKKVELVERTPEALERYGISHRVVVSARVLGPRIGKDVQLVIAAVKAGDYQSADDGLHVAGHVLTGDEYDQVLDASQSGRAIEFVGDSGFVLMDTELTADLQDEGLARDLIRVVQHARKDADFQYLTALFFMSMVMLMSSGLSQPIVTSSPRRRSRQIFRPTT
jgi:Isoleucyl-tRNA synthetase